MKKPAIFFVFLTLLIILCPLSFAQKGHITLLAVSELTDGKFEGSTADLYLEIKPGTGRVYIDTFPITKLDTQMTTRFAKEMACKYLDMDCSIYDFFYTIKADTSIIAGPSAGAATNVLTISVLGKIPLDAKTVVTGSIDSGYLVGHVGGLKEKIEAAKKAGFRKVLIPKGDTKYSNNNTTIDLYNISKQINISVVEVSDTDDVLYEFTGKIFAKIHSNITINKDYEKIMSDLAVSLCNRTNSFESKINFSNPALNSSEFDILHAKNLTIESRKEFDKQRYYSSASMCFGANVVYLQYIYFKENMSFMQYELKKEQLKKEANSFVEEMKKKELNTITDLETVMIAVERLNDAIYYADQISKDNSSMAKAKYLSYAQERLNSAYLWEKFYGQPGKKIILNKDDLKESCMTKVSEAEERYQYAKLYFPDYLTDIKADINKAYNYFEEKEYALCLFTATKAKARSNLILSSISISNDKVDILLDQKMTAAKNTISEEVEKGIFPLMGYSYFEYANALKSQDPFSALIYSEYALELSNLDVYFKGIPSKSKFAIDYDKLYIFFAGFILGILMFFGIYLAARQSKSKKLQIKKIKTNKIQKNKKKSRSI